MVEGGKGTPAAAALLCVERERERELKARWEKEGFAPMIFPTEIKMKKCFIFWCDSGMEVYDSSYAFFVRK